MAYTSTTLTLAMTEFLAHVATEDFDPDAPPELVYVTAILPDETVLTISEVGATLPEGWDDVPAPSVDAELGDAWVREARSLSLIVPSVHVPIAVPEKNVLINPLHRDFVHVTWMTDRFGYDRRLISARVAADRRRH
jgi:RES domain-containing protein